MKIKLIEVTTRNAAKNAAFLDALPERPKTLGLNELISRVSFFGGKLNELKKQEARGLPPATEDEIKLATAKVQAYQDEYKWRKYQH
jgi:hypothetical protein